MLWQKLIGFAILSLVLTQLQFVQSNVGASGCKANFTAVAGKCLSAVREYLNWYEADRDCRSRGAGLLSIQNQTQLQQIEQWLNVTAPWVMEFWTSGNSLGQRGTYYWQSTGELARYLNWAANQPRQNDGDCLSLVSNNYTVKGYYDYRLSVKDCAYFLPHICEHQPGNNTNFNTTTRICLKPGSYENAQVLL